MHLLICAATRFEIAPTLQWLETEKLPNVQVLVTGVGLVSTAYALTREVCTARPRYMIQAGIGGALDPTLTLAQSFAVSSEAVPELGVMESQGFKSVFEMGFADPDKAPWTKGKLDNSDEAKRSGLTTLRAASVNEVSTRLEWINHLHSQGLQVESMEGAAFHYVGLMEKIPFLQIRSLSNFAGERDKSRWKLKASIESLNEALQELVIKRMQL